MLRSRLGVALGLLAFVAGCGSSDDSPESGDASTGDAAITDANGGAITDANSDSPADGGVAQCTGIGSGYQKYKQAFYGDLHTHTILSADAWGMGTRNEPADAYEFARGAPKEIAAGATAPLNSGPTVTIGRALDFDAVTDHSEWIAATQGCAEFSDGGALDPSSPFTGCELLLAEHDLSVAAVTGATAVLKKNCGVEDEEQDAAADCISETNEAWNVEQSAANAANVPCTFTTFNAYEWTAMDNTTGATLHKNVIFANEHVPTVPYDFLDYPVATDLWTALDTGCTSAAGCTVMTIPHNSNLSNGHAFDLPSTKAGLDQMVKYQKLVEIYQHKGASECAFPNSLSGDPKCDFEQADKDEDAGIPNLQSFVRTALENGLVDYQDGGVNPLMLGIVGATDDHNGLPGNVAESTFPGHIGDNDNTARLRLSADGTNFGPGAITGVWAEENTRESIYAALGRRETFATSGTRIAVRFYQTWSATNFCGGGFPGNVIDSGAIPMGGTMSAKPSGATSPYFVIDAMKDETDLAEIDVVKGTVVDGQIVETVTPISAAGSPAAMCTTWQDPTFATAAPAFYYVRVLEQPTPRWSHYDCLAAPDVQGCGPDGGLDVNIQERAWTSPIWFLP